MAEFKYEITQRIAVLSQSANGWERQLNMVSWNDREPKYDIRDWSPDGSKMGKGISHRLFQSARLHPLSRRLRGGAGDAQPERVSRPDGPLF